MLKEALALTSGVLDYLLAPREDHRGWKTPSEASRILLVVVVLSVAYWAWPITQGNVQEG